MFKERGNSRLFPVLAMAVALLVGIVLGTFVLQDSKGAELAAFSDQLIQSGKGKPLVLEEEAGLADGFKKVARTVGPAVVNIRTRGVVQQSLPQLPEGNDFLERFFGRPLPEEREVRGLGSGVIVDSDGYIITNHHLIDRADTIDVKLHDGSVFQAEVIGSDELTDIAVLRMDAGRSLPFVEVGDSGGMEVGDWVLAIGSPFGFEQTVTAGIISATHREVDPRIGSNPFGDYIQTDASINPGNSGGPLVNMKGQVIGINSWISTRSGQSAGVGFAIPSDVFINSYNQLRTHGYVERGWLGIRMNLFSMTPEMAEYFGVAGDDPSGIKDGDGVIVTGLINEAGEPGQEGPAYKAGIRPEDVIVQIDGREIESDFDLRSAIANTPPGKTVRVTVVRKGRVLEFDVALAERQLERQQQAEGGSLSFEARPKEQKEKKIGLVFGTLAARDAEQLGIEGSAVVVEDVEPGSRAAEASLAPGHVIMEVNGTRVESADQFKRVIDEMNSGAAVVLRVIAPPSPRARNAQANIYYTSFRKP